MRVSRCGVLFSLERLVMTVAVVIDYVWLQYIISVTLRLLLSALCRQQGAVCALYSVNDDGWRT